MPVVVPIENGTLGFRFLLIGFMILVFLIIHRQWRSAAVRREDVLRLVALAAEESYVADEEIRGTEENLYEKVRATDLTEKVRANTTDHRRLQMFLIIALVITIQPILVALKIRSILVWFWGFAYFG